MIYTYYLALERNEVLIRTKTWMNLQNVMLSERSQTQRNTYCRIPLIWNSRRGKTICSDRKISACLVWEGVIDSKGNEGIWEGGVGTFYILIEVMLPWVYTCVKTHLNWMTAELLSSHGHTKCIATHRAIRLKEIQKQPIHWVNEKIHQNVQVRAKYTLTINLTPSTTLHYGEGTPNF